MVAVRLCIGVCGAEEQESGFRDLARALLCREKTRGIRNGHRAFVLLLHGNRWPNAYSVVSMSEKCRRSSGSGSSLCCCVVQ
jgi:hypothetical protein